jgi:hypothetical protein
MNWAALKTVFVLFFWVRCEKIISFDLGIFPVSNPIAHSKSANKSEYRFVGKDLFVTTF